MPKRFYKHEYKGKYKFIKRWYDDREGAAFEKEVDEWLTQFNREEQNLLLECLKRYSYFRAAEYRYGQRILYSKLQSFNPKWKEEALIFKIYKKDASYSDNFFNDFWLNNGIKELCKQNIDDFKEHLELLNSIILLDDYIGSGDTILKYLESKLQEMTEIASKKIVVLTLFLTRSGELALKSFAMDRKLDLTILYYKKGDKFFKEGRYYRGQQLQENIDLYEKLCEKKHISKHYWYGYENIQSLYSICRNTPNDTLGIFWQSNKNYDSLMPRHKNDDIGLNRIIRDKEKLKEARKEELYKKEVESIQNLLFIGYCARKKSKFDFGQACSRFGLTQNQIEIKIEYVMDKGFLAIKEGKFIETEKFWKCVRQKRYKEYFDGFLNEEIEETTLDLKEINYMTLNFEEKFKGYKQRR